MRIDELFLDVTFYLYHNKDDALNGTGGGGCGFFVRYPSVVHGDFGELHMSHMYAVTNKHVIQNMSGVYGNISPVIRTNTVNWGPAITQPERHSWIPHPEGHDLVVCPIELATGYHKFYTVNYAQLLTREKMRELKFGVGSEVMAIGRFKTHEGQQKNTPVARFGHISMMPSEPIYNGMLQIEQESFLVECHSASGYSGSPIFVEEFGKFHSVAWYQDSEISIGPFILGIVWAHMDEYVAVESKQGEVIDPDWRVKFNTGMMAVVPGWRLIELLDSGEVKEKRSQEEERIVNLMNSKKWKTTTNESDQ